jgi:folate-binding protein YgfZ
LRAGVGVVDLSCRSRLCVTGADRVRFLHGQVTNDVQRLRSGEGCYAALVNAKGKLQSDLNIFCLADELLLDFEPGYRDAVVQRLDKFVVTEDVQLLDAAPHYGLVSALGPRAAQAVAQLGFPWALPARPYAFGNHQDPALGRFYLMRRAGLGNSPAFGSGFDLFIPIAALAPVFERLAAAAQSLGGRTCGWEALETVRIEWGIPRFGQDMDESNLPPEAGIESRAVSYSKGCYIGQEVIARLRTYGQVAKSLRGLRLPAGWATRPARGDKLFADDKEVGQVTSAIATFALGYVRKEHHAPGTALTLCTTTGECPVTVTELPSTI